MSQEPNSDQNAESPFFPSGYTPETQEGYSGYEAFLQVSQSQYSGPIPHPKTLEHYEHILPGAAERILCMAEENARNLREARTTQLENERLSDQSGHDIVKRGQHYGHIICTSPEIWCDSLGSLF